MRRRPPNNQTGKARTAFREKVAYRLWALPRSPREVDASVLLLGTMRRVGWTRSIRRSMPLDRSGNPLPWWTYPAILWLETVIRPEHRVLEFGAGYSTLWLASRVSSLVSIEHDELWASRIASRAPAHATILHRTSVADRVVAPPDDPYVRAIEELSGGFDLIVIDGLARRTCAERSLAILAGNGVILVDNTDRPEFSSVLSVLEKAGLYRVDFAGPVPAGTNFSCSSVFFSSPEGWFSKGREPTDWGTEIPDFEVV